MTKPLRERLIELGHIVPDEVYAYRWNERPFLSDAAVKRLRESLIRRGILMPKILRPFRVGVH